MELLEISHELGLQEAANKELGILSNQELQVNAYLHNVASNESTVLSDETLQAQFDVLANAFAPYGVNFSLAGTTKTVNKDWSNGGAELKMKTTLRQGSYSDLNIYL